MDRVLRGLRVWRKELTGTLADLSQEKAAARSRQSAVAARLGAMGHTSGNHAQRQVGRAGVCCQGQNTEASLPVCLLLLKRQAGKKSGASPTPPHSAHSNYLLSPRAAAS